MRVSHPAEGSLTRVFGTRTYDVGQVDVFESKDASLPRAVMFRDSNGSFMMPFLGMHFSRIVAVASASVFYDLLRDEKPDAVIVQVSERALCEPVESGLADRFYFPDDHGPDDFATFSGVTLPLPTTRNDIANVVFRHDGERVWSVGPRTELILTGRVPYVDCELQLTVSPYLYPPRSTEQRLVVVVNGHHLGCFAVTEDDQIVTCGVPVQALFSGRTVRVELLHPDCAVPKSLGDGDDERALSVLFDTLVFRVAG